MKNTLLALFFVLFTATGLRAQFRLGLTAGPQWASVKETNQIANWSTTTSPYYKNRTSFHLGFLAEIPINQRLFLQPGLFQSGKGRKYEKVNPGDIAALTDTLLYRAAFLPDYIDLPVNIGYKYELKRNRSISASTGPMLSLFRKGTQTTEFRSLSTNKFVKEEDKLESGKSMGKVHTTDLAWNIRATADLGKFFLTAFYSRGLTNFFTANYPTKMRHQTLGLSLGIWLNKAPQVKPRDRDGDGIPDGSDLCPTQPGLALTKGCPDKDDDGIADAIDLCPGQAGTAKYKGCPVPDKDEDGINDENDQCPDVRGVEKYKGCPVPDSDRDGISDEEDQCPDRPGTAKYKGCPVPDTDQDGVNDETDECPDQPGNAKYRGCPVPDKDQDGINDEQDECPNFPGTVENKGCPAIRKEIVEKVNYAAKNIFFDLNSARILPRSHAALNDVVSILRENIQLRLTVSGHTDNMGDPDYNLAFSQKRANAVLEYIQAQGIERGRLTAVGYGQTRPLADNKTASGRAQNRRVEMALTQ